MKAARPGQFMFITRLQAARLLRAARNPNAENLGERIGWALAAMKDSRHAQCLKIDYLLRIGNFDSADAMLARHLLTGREHPLMRLRFARSMFLQGRLESAKREITRVMNERPSHVGAKQVAADVATACGEHDLAVQLLVIARDLRPTCNRLRTQLTEALLNAGLIKHALRELEHLANPPVVLRARVLRASGRAVEAAEALRKAAEATSDLNLRRAALLELVATSEAVGDIDQLNRIPEWTQRESGLPEADQCEIADHVVQACRRAGILPVSRTELESIISKPRKPVSPADDAEAARLWLGRLLSQLLAEQADAATSGADPSLHLLPHLLEQAAATLNRQMAANNAAPAGRLETLRQHRDLIQHALGRP